MINYDSHHWLERFFDLRGSMLRDVLPRIALLSVWAGGIVVFHEKVRPIGIPSTIHALVGTALGLLLVFRTNTSYDRFWEGRKAWGGIVNESRNLARLGSVLVGKENPALFQQMTLWTVAFAYSAMNRLRGNSPGFGDRIESLLTPEQVAEGRSAQHAPLFASIQVSKAIHQAKQQGLVSDYLQVALDQNIQQLIDYLGACERIHRTPIPFAYIVHLRRALILYCGTLPFALVQNQGWSVVPEVMLITFIFLGIEEIGVEIEDPFGVDDNDLPLETFCKTIEDNLLAISSPQ